MDFREVSSPSATHVASYGDGGFRIGEHRVKGSIILTARGYYPWPVENMDDISLISLKTIKDQASDIDLLLMGTGQNMVFLSKEIRHALEGLDIAVDVMATGAAARTYNVLLMEGRKVAAALVAVE